MWHEGFQGCFSQVLFITACFEKIIELLLTNKRKKIPEKRV
jgi:hypothetical protein